MNTTKLINSVAIVFSLFIFLIGMFFLFTDYQPIVGTGSSMEPVYYQHDLMVMDTEGFEVEEGDIIRYSYQDIDVGHKVVEVNKDYYRTRGVNNEGLDKVKVTDEMITGEVVFILPVSPKRLP